MRRSVQAVDAFGAACPRGLPWICADRTAGFGLPKAAGANRHVMRRLAIRRLEGQTGAIGRRIVCRAVVGRAGPSGVMGWCVAGHGKAAGARAPAWGSDGLVPRQGADRVPVSGVATDIRTGARARSAGQLDGAAGALTLLGQGGGQRVLDGMKDQVAHGAGVAEADLGLGGVDVGVHQRGVDGQKERKDGVALAVQAVAEGLADGLGQHAVAHEAAVDEQVLPVAAGAGSVRFAQQAFHGQRTGLGRDGQQPRAVAHQTLDALGGRGGRPAAHFTAVLMDDELHGRMRQGNAPDGVQAVSGLGGRRLEELAPRRGGREQVDDLDDGTGGNGGGLGRRGRLARLHVHFPAVFGGQWTAGQRQARDGGHRSQGLAPEAQRGDMFQVGQRGNLAGGVPGQGQRQLVFLDAPAVVDDLKPAQTAFLDADLDLAGPGIQRVLQQFLDGGGRALDDLAGGDLADQHVGQQGNGAGGLGAGCGGQGELAGGRGHIRRGRRRHPPLLQSRPRAGCRHM